MPQRKASSRAGQASQPPDVAPEWVAGDTRRLLLKAGAFLLEFVACAPPDMETAALESRLAAACARIEGRLASDHPYRPLLAALRTLLPEPAQPSQAEDVSRDGSDTGTMPFPIHYDTSAITQYPLSIAPCQSHQN